MNKSPLPIAVLIRSIVFAGCEFGKKIKPPSITNFEECVAAGNLIMESYPRQCRADNQTFVEEIKEPSSPAPEAYTPSDPLEIFLVELTRTTKLPFENPVKADIFWSEGEDRSNLTVFFGDSFLINLPSIGPNDETIVADYFAAKGFAKMKFNESVGEDSHKVGYRKDNLICKYDRSQYPDETQPHLVVYCTDATKGTERK